MRLLLLFVCALAACGSDRASLSGDLPDGSSSSSSGLPCDVEAALATCQSCHGRPLAGGAPIALSTYTDLTRTSPAGGTMADRAIVRMQSTTAPMPPAPSSPASPADVSTLEAWVASGMPAGDCGGGTNPFDQPVQCSSGRTWTGGNEESPLMHPGVACIACHRTEFEAPQFTIAGTVYLTGHEPNDCYGSTGASVEITDANGATQSLPVNSAGNFYSSTAFAFPIRAKVIANGQERVMAAPQASGDCNTCHTQDGASMAPGRVALP